MLSQPKSNSIFKINPILGIRKSRGHKYIEQTVDPITHNTNVYPVKSLHLLTSTGTFSLSHDKLKRE
jgi:hypothetical protein